ncbi:MAG: hypothetical protein Q7S45_02050 [Candidatus Curtissbacteria bacterium]|nr:hypothetical protein [Candidatus Curtissbacteria bacterium]
MNTPLNGQTDVLGDLTASALDQNEEFDLMLESFCDLIIDSYLVKKKVLQDEKQKC